MKVKLWIFVESDGAGSAFPNFFNTQEECEEYAAKVGDIYDERLGEDTAEYTLEFDNDGVLLNPSKLSDLDDI